MSVSEWQCRYHLSDWGGLTPPRPCRWADILSKLGDLCPSSVGMSQSGVPCMARVVWDFTLHWLSVRPGNNPPPPSLPASTPLPDRHARSCMSNWFYLEAMCTGQAKLCVDKVWYWAHLKPIWEQYSQRQRSPSLDIRLPLIFLGSWSNCLYCNFPIRVIESRRQTSLLLKQSCSSFSSCLCKWELLQVFKGQVPWFLNYLGTS